MNPKTLQQTLETLNARYPNAFVLHTWESHHPLRLGIDQELFASGITSKTAIRRTLGVYTRRVMYLRACQPGAARTGLDGAPVGLVTDHEAQHARETLETILRTREGRRRLRSTAQRVRTE